MLLQRLSRSDTDQKEGRESEMKSEPVFEKPHDWDKIPESRYTLNWWKTPFPEFDPDNVSTALSRAKSEASLILTQYDLMKKEGFAKGFSIFIERKTQITVDNDLEVCQDGSNS